MLPVLILNNSCTKNEEAIDIKDADGNIYSSVTIGAQVWMVENLKTTRYSDGTTIPNATDYLEGTNITVGAYCWYDNDIANKSDYGGLYNWYAVKTDKICPTGWHLPSDSELTTLAILLGGEDVAGSKLKEAGTAHWIEPNIGATNESGFTALPGGVRYDSGQFGKLGSVCYLFSSAEYWVYALYHSDCTFNGGLGIKKGWFSVRCLKDK
jgi:uncharacterized protein (TIGR02145 family)